MKKLLYIFATAALTMTMSCGNSEKAGQSEKSVEDSLRADSIKKVEMAIEAQRQDSIRQDSIRQDSMWRYRSTPDLAIYELHGPVKSVTYHNFDGNYVTSMDDPGVLFSYYNGSKTYYYREDGTLKGVTNYKINRDANGRIKSVKSNERLEFDDYTISYDKQNRPIKIQNSGMEWGYTITYKYDKYGNVISDRNDGGMESFSWDYNSAFTYKEFDDFGNWTKRNRSTKCRNYECDELVSTKTTNAIESRTITYYSKK